MGSCAEGYGVCCVIQLGCGSKSSDNCTYLVQESSSTPTNPCHYDICPANTAICRIRFDFIKFESVPPQAQVTGSTVIGAIGDCTTDAFRDLSSIKTCQLFSSYLEGVLDYHDLNYTCTICCLLTVMANTLAANLPAS
jgi:hypothetical protein